MGFLVGFITDNGFVGHKYAGSIESVKEWVKAESGCSDVITVLGFDSSDMEQKFGAIDFEILKFFDEANVSISALDTLLFPISELEDETRKLFMNTLKAVLDSRLVQNVMWRAAI